ncbi:hypothetical protein [Paenibacillus xylaniclasticus]|uniref:hypothetical protein n=1 Tax=Paenibacillus xylaniclasticus TaxID=588083 RepID=UPI000FD90CE3|nr:MULTISPECIES: hypothetical protein [Paenibacillus]GFN33096.1 hypothetical protein PCURB6_33560 [Paenibacillus curdlanolyticus]
MSELNIKLNGNKYELVFTDNGEARVLTKFYNNLTEKATDVYIEGIINIFNSVTPLSKYVPETSWDDVVAIVSSMFDYLLQTNGKNIKMLELSGFHLNTYYQAKALQLFSESNTLFSFCHWEPMKGIDQLQNVSNAYLPFYNLMTSLNVSGTIIPLAGDRSKVIHSLHNGYFDMIVVREERYGSLLQQIVQAIRKIKPGGLLIGYFSDCYYDQLPAKLQSRSFEEDERTNGGYHTGVIYALKQLFDDDYERPVSSSNVWTKTITKEVKEHVLAKFCYPSDIQSIRQLVQMGHSIEKCIYLLESFPDTAGLLQNIGAAITACELPSANLALASAIPDVKKAIVEMKSQHTETIIRYRQNDVEKMAASIAHTEVLLKAWLQSLNDLEKWCMYER